MFSSKTPWWVVAVTDSIVAAERAGEIIREGSRLADEVEVFIIEGRSVELELKRTRIGEAKEAHAWTYGIRTITEGKIGVSSSNDPDRWRDCLTASIESGRFATPQEWHGLPQPATIHRTVSIYDPSLAVDPAVARDLLSALLEGARTYPADVVGGSAGLSVSTVCLANSNGVLYEKRRTGAGVSIETIRGTSTGYEYDQSCFLDLDPRDVGEKAAFHAVHSENGQDIKTGTYDVILSPLALADLLSHIVVPALSGRNVKAGRSFLADKLGEECMDSALSLYDDPFIRGLGSTVWDAEGVPTQQLDFVRDGVLGCFAYDLKTAYRYGEETTASAVRGGAGGAPAIGVHNLVLDGPRSDVDSDRAIAVHSLVGAHTANPITGDFSVELSNPTWVEGGTIGDPIRSAMLAGNLFAMLADIAAIGEDTRVVGHIILPSVRFDRQHIIGK